MCSKDILSPRSSLLPCMQLVLCLTLCEHMLIVWFFFVYFKDYNLITIFLHSLPHKPSDALLRTLLQIKGTFSSKCYCTYICVYTYILKYNLANMSSQMSWMIACGDKDNTSRHIKLHGESPWGFKPMQRITENWVNLRVEEMVLPRELCWQYFNWTLSCKHKV